MMTTQYLPLTEYSSKHRVSISTLRRRIKAEDIRFRFEDGKYLILDEPMSTHQRVHRPSQQTSDETLMGAHAGAIVRESAPVFGLNNYSFHEESNEEKNRSQSPPPVPQTPNMQLNHQQHEESVLSAANRLLTELKKAYSQILQEKEEQILILKEEVSDLKTLTKVLESENERMKFGRR